MFPRTDETGKKYNNLTFLNALREGGAGKGTVWLVRCDCGTLIEGYRKDIVREKKKTCGRKECPYRIQRARQPTQRSNSRVRTAHSRNQREMYARYIYDAARRKLTFAISPELFMELILQPCSYCGSPPEKGGVRKCNGIDRLDNNGPYIPENCVSCCITCNRMKSSMPVVRFIQHVENLYIHLHKIPTSIEST